jgi:hypothetical protein
VQSTASIDGAKDRDDDAKGSPHAALAEHAAPLG